MTTDNQSKGKSTNCSRGTRTCTVVEQKLRERRQKRGRDEDYLSDDDDEENDGEQDGESICLADIPQAFSHFTYRYTKRKLLVCDLQGVLSGTSPLLELTDPVIHFRSRLTTWTK